MAAASPHYTAAALAVALEDDAPADLVLDEHVERCDWCAARMADVSIGRAPALPDPTALTDRYALPDELTVWAGGQGVVCRGAHRDLGHPVALKLLRAWDGADERLMAEGRKAARLTHPHVAPFHDVFRWDGRACLVMPFMPNGTLEQRLRAYPPAAAAALGADLADAVQHAHDAGIWHRDLKPANVLFDERGTPRVADFGLAVGAGEAAAGWEGTPGFMAPEQARGDAAAISPRTDVYGLAAVLFWVLAGRPPGPGGRPPAVPPGVPADLAAVCLRGLAEDPAARYATAAGFAADLRRFVGRRPVAARRRPGRAAWLWAVRDKSRAAAAGLVVAAAVAGPI